ncbi:hypothetical protein [Rhodanobacter sp. UC4436_H3]
MFIDLADCRDVDQVAKLAALNILRAIEGFIRQRAIRLVAKDRASGILAVMQFLAGLKELPNLQRFLGRIVPTL